ncbi:MAG TPA: transglutaminase-like domain-containing protein [Thermomicrobiales bacterium]|jgi:hypothetical protein|nr:transglutaminase-like domain-containing protein [Thermomicrobiales bacterium]
MATTVPTPIYASQSQVTDPGLFAARLDEIPDDLTSIKDAVNHLVYHYRHPESDWAVHGIAPERIGEIDTRYAEHMLERLLTLNDTPLTEHRQPAERIVGCCRDFTVLFLSIARHKGIPARMRVGFATYFQPDWKLDHVVAEVWDAAGQRWRMVDAELGDGHIDPNDGARLDPLDLPRDRFITGPQAWVSCRREEADPERFLVAPELDIPDTRGWPYLMHNVVHDLASLNMQEMLLWEAWGILLRESAMLPDHLVLLDQVASAAAGTDSTPDQLQELYERDEFRVPARVMSYSPAAPDIPVSVDIAR